MRSLRSLGLVALVVGIGAACAAAQDSGLAPVNPSPLAPKQDPASRLKQSGDAAKKADKPEKAAPTRRPMPVFVTFSQIDWAGPEANPRAKIALAKYFEEAFPEGLRVGVDEKGMKSFELKSLKAVRKFLPNGGKSGVLEDSSYESLEDCGSLAGHLVAAKINLRFNQRGFLGEPEEGVKNPLVTNPRASLHVLASTWTSNRTTPLASRTKPTIVGSEVMPSRSKGPVSCARAAWMVGPKRSAWVMTT